MLVPENTLPLAKIKVAFINSLTRPSVPVHFFLSQKRNAQSVSRYCIENSYTMQEASVIFSKSFSLLFSKEYLAQNLGKLDKQYSPGGKEMFTGFVRTVILYLVLIVGIRLMGKRQVGELEPSELVLSLVIADLAAVPMQDLSLIHI